MRTLDNGERIDDQTMLEAFEGATLPADAWTHAAHLHAAFGLMRRYGPHEGLVRMRSGIFGLNAAHGTATTAFQGYHETMTVAWFVLVAAAVRDTGALTFEELVNRKPGLLDPATLRHHYSAERLESLEARARFLAPDRALLPAV